MGGYFGYGTRRGGAVYPAISEDLAEQGRSRVFHVRVPRPTNSQYTEDIVLVRGLAYIHTHTYPCSKLILCIVVSTCFSHSITLSQAHVYHTASGTPRFVTMPMSLLERCVRCPSGV